jgi:hypothetical protein
MMALIAGATAYATKVKSVTIMAAVSAASYTQLVVGQKCIKFIFPLHYALKSASHEQVKA